MATRWRVAGLVAAAITFVAALVRPLPGNDLLASLPLVVQAVICAISVFIAVWLYEAVFRLVLWVVRALVPTNAEPRE